MTSKSTVDAIVRVTRQLPPAVSQLAHVLLAHDEELPAHIKNGLICTLLATTPRLEPLSRLDTLVCELLANSTPKLGRLISRTKIASCWLEIDKMEKRHIVTAAVLWFSTVCQIAADDPDVESPPVLH